MIDQSLLGNLFEQAKVSERLSKNYDLHTNKDYGAQRMLNVMPIGTVVSIHRYPISLENVICLQGRFYEVLVVMLRFRLSRIAGITGIYEIRGRILEELWEES